MDPVGITVFYVQDNYQQGVSCPLVPTLPFTLVELLTAQSVSSGVVVSYPGQLMTYTFSVSSVPDSMGKPCSLEWITGLKVICQQPLELRSDLFKTLGLGDFGNLTIWEL